MVFLPRNLLDALVGDGFRLSHGTVYNNLKLFDAAGVVRRRRSEDGARFMNRRFAVKHRTV